MSDPGFTVEVAVDLEGVERHRAQWEALAEVATHPNVFLEPWMALAALRVYGARGVRFVFVYEPLRAELRNRRLLAGVFAVQTTKLAGTPFAILQLWRYPYCSSAVPLLHPELGRQALAAFLEWVGEEARGGLVRLQLIPGEGSFHHALLEEVERLGWSFLVDDLYARALLVRAPSAASYLERALDTKRRREYRRLRNRLAERGLLEARALSAGEDAGPWIDRFLALESAGWKGKGGSALLSKDRDAAFFRDAMMEAHARGRLEIFGLFQEGKPLALKCNLLRPPGAFAFRIAYDEAYARSSPGVLLEVENIDRFHANAALEWMDSCASRSRFLVNHLWTERLVIQTMIFATGRRSRLLLALIPLLRWIRGGRAPRIPREEKRNE